MNYSEKTLVMVGSKFIDQAMRIITKGELAKVATTWKLANLGGCHVWVTTATPHWPKWNWGRKGGCPFLPEGWPHGGEECCLDNVWGPIHTTQKVTIPHLVQSVHMTILVSGDTVCRSMCLQSQCQAPVAYHSGANCDLWRVTSGVLLGACLSVQLECLLCQNPHKNGGWPGHACQPSTTSSPSNSEVRGVYWQPLKRVDLGGPGPPWPGGMSQTGQLLLK